MQTNTHTWKNTYTHTDRNNVRKKNRSGRRMFYLYEEHTDRNHCTNQLGWGHLYTTPSEWTDINISNASYAEQYHLKTSTLCPRFYKFMVLLEGPNLTHLRQVVWVAIIRAFFYAAVWSNNHSSLPPMKKCQWYRFDTAIATMERKGGRCTLFTSLLLLYHQAFDV